MFVIDAHRNHCGPYTAAGALVRRVSGHAGRAAADLIGAHLLSLLCVAPELAADFPPPPELVAWQAFSREGNSPAWTLRVAHGVADFLLAYFARFPAAGGAIRFVNLAEADPTDREFVSVLQRRADPAVVTVRAEPADEAARVPVADAAEAHIDSDCSASAPAWRAAYAALDTEERRRLHRARVAALEAEGGLSRRLGAVPYHHMAAEDGAESLLSAADRCMRLAYYDAALEWAERGLRLCDPAESPEQYGRLTRNVLFALLLLGRLDAVEELCHAVERDHRDPALLAHVTYAMAIMNVRLYERARQDYDAAKAWIERSLDFTAKLPSSEVQAVNHAFLLNTMALVEMRKGDRAAALDRLEAGLRYMAEHAPGKYPLECGLLLHNRARLHLADGKPECAIADLTEVLRFEPGNSEAYLDRGLQYQRAHRYEAALEDYAAAIRWSPPYWEPHFNRAQTLAALGRRVEAVAEYDRVCMLHPDHAEALVNRGTLRFELGRFAGAREDADAALWLAPEDARARCLDGLLRMAAGDLAEAASRFSAAIEADPSLADAWANRATIRFKQHRREAALEDLDRAVALRPDAGILYNRGRVHEALGRWTEAAEDYRRALTLNPVDEAKIRRRLDACFAQIAAPPL